MYKIGDVVKFAYGECGGPIFEFEGEIIGLQNNTFLIYPRGEGVSILENFEWGFVLSPNDWKNCERWHYCRVVVALHYNTIFSNGVRRYWESMWIVPEAQTPQKMPQEVQSNDKFLDDLRLDARKYSTNSEGETGGPSGLRFL